MNADVLVLGGGLAGLSAALEARRAGADVLLLCKGRAGRSGSSLVAAGHLSGVHSGIGDDEEAFVRDTVAGGRGINDPSLVAALARGSREVVPFLEACGVALARRGGALEVGATPGHSRRRTASAAAADGPTCSAGLGLTLPLLREAERRGVRLLDGASALALGRAGGRVAGVLALLPEGPRRVATGAVVLACGGGARVYARTNNTADVTGDGAALAYEAGAELRDLEFVQFHPTMGISPLRAVFSTTLFGEGAVLRNRLGERFLLRGASSEAGATRDAMSRAILAEIAEGRGVGGGVVLDLSGVPPQVLAERFGGLGAALARHAAAPLVVAPCAHFLMGGVTIDASGATTVPGLFAAGEVSGGVHGANRLGGSALTEAVFFGRLAGASAARASAQASSASAWEEVNTRPGFPEGVPPSVVRQVRSLTWECAGLLRTGEGLREGLRRLRDVAAAPGAPGSKEPTRSDREARSLFLLSRLILEAALRRTESRGAHWRSDHPDADDEAWRGSLRVLRGEDGGPAFRYLSLPPQAPP